VHNCAQHCLYKLGYSTAHSSFLEHRHLWVQSTGERRRRSSCAFKLCTTSKSIVC